jgi:transposase
MQDTALYQYLLGLKSPWTVSRVNLNVQGHRVDVWAEHSEHATWTCPHCADVAASGQLPVPDVSACENSPSDLRRAWRGAGPGSVGRAAVAVHAVVRAPDHRRAASMRRKRRAVTRGRNRKARRVVRRIGVDEKAAAKGHRYLTLV